MKKRIGFLLAALLFISASAQAGNGDLTANGNVKVGGGLTFTNPNYHNTGHYQIELPGYSGIGVFSGLVFMNPSEFRFVDGINDMMTLKNLSDDWYIYQLQVEGTVLAEGFQQVSDINYKQNILPLEGSLNKILGIRGVSYEWKPFKNKSKSGKELKSGRHFGVIAQEIEKVLPEAVKVAPNGSKSVAYMEIIPVLIEAIKEQQQEIEQLKKALSRR